MTDKNEKSTDEILREQHAAEGGTGPAISSGSTPAATPAPATGPAFTVSTVDGDVNQELFNARLQGIRINGEPMKPADFSSRKGKSKKDGEVVVTATGVPTYAGDATLRAALGGSRPMPLKLTFADGNSVSDTFILRRMDHSSGVDDREYTFVLENATASDED